MNQKGEKRKKEKERKIKQSIVSNNVNVYVSPTQTRQRTAIQLSKSSNMYTLQKVRSTSRGLGGAGAHPLNLCRSVSVVLSGDGDCQLGMNQKPFLGRAVSRHAGSSQRSQNSLAGFGRTPQRCAAGRGKQTGDRCREEGYLGKKERTEVMGKGGQRRGVKDIIAVYTPSGPP